MLDCNPAQYYITSLSFKDLQHLPIICQWAKKFGPCHLILPTKAVCDVVGRAQARSCWNRLFEGLPILTVPQVCQWRIHALYLNLVGFNWVQPNWVNVFFSSLRCIALFHRTGAFHVVLVIRSTYRIWLAYSVNWLKRSQTKTGVVVWLVDRCSTWLMSCWTIVTAPRLSWTWWPVPCSW
jgi:hypothetical protein